MVGGVAGGRQRSQGAVGLAVGGRDHLGAEPRGAVGVVAVGVGQQHGADPASILGGGANRLEVTGVVGARVDHQAGIGAVEVGVGPLQRHRPRIGGDETRDLGVARRLLGYPATSLAIASRASSGSSTTRSPAPRRISRTRNAVPA